MLDWEFRQPWLLLLALLAPVVYYLAVRSPNRVNFSTLQVFQSVPRSLRGRLSNVPSIMLSAAAVCLAVALAGPRTPDAETKVSREGIAIMMVVDRSSSMNARDMIQGDASVDRLTAVKGVFRHFVLGEEGRGGRPDDLIGWIGFAHYADSLCPLTLDHGNLATIVDDLEIVTQESEDGTAIGDGLALAVERLRRNKAKSRIAILLTDGVNNRGNISPDRAAELASSQDVKVYCIGAGTNGLAPFPVQDFFGRTVMRPVQVEIDEATLKQIAEKTGGQYFRATDLQSLAAVYDEIDQLERTEVTELRYLQYTEHYHAFVLCAFVMLSGSLICTGTVFRRLP